MKNTCKTCKYWQFKLGGLESGKEWGECLNEKVDGTIRLSFRHVYIPKHLIENERNYIRVQFEESSFGCIYYQGDDPEDSLQVLSYLLENNDGSMVILKRTLGNRWVITRGGRFYLPKVDSDDDGIFRLEYARWDEGDYISRYVWDTVEEAYNFWKANRPQIAVGRADFIRLGLFE